MPLGTRLQKLHVILFVYKKQKEKDLILFTSRNSSLALWISLLSLLGASGGLVTIWNGGLLDGSVVHFNSYSIILRFFYRLDNKTFHLTNIYGPAHTAGKQAFVIWLMNFDMSTFDDWVLGGYPT